MVSSRNRRLIIRLALVLVIAAIGAIQARRGDDRATTTGTVEAAFQDERSGIMLEAAGRVQRVLEDDREGSRHQRFVLALPSDHTVLVAHNIYLAPRVPLAAGDKISLYGQYEWNDRGGVIHWTHHDPDGRHEGGWIDFGGRRYE